MENLERGENEERRQAQIRRRRRDMAITMAKCVLYGVWYGLIPVVLVALDFMCCYFINMIKTLGMEAYHEGQLRFADMIYASAAIIGFVTFMISSSVLYVRYIIMEGVIREAFRV